MIAAGLKVKAWIVGCLLLGAFAIGGCASKAEPRTSIEPTYSYLRQPMASAEHGNNAEQIGSDQPDSGDGFRY
jgi:hypothetical protein